MRFDGLILDSRRALFVVEREALIISDLFLGLGAVRRKKTDVLPNSQNNDLWERLFGLLQDYKPKSVALLGDIKPSQGSVEDDEAEELLTLFRKLGANGRVVTQIVNQMERASGPVMETAGITLVESYMVGLYTLMHRRKIFVYPRHEVSAGFWINGGVHPLFAVPTPGPQNEADWLRYPAFLYTGFALVMPPFVSYAQGWEVIQVERLPKQARAWGVLGDRMKELDLSALPSPPEALRQIVRPPSKSKAKHITEDEA
jgi:metallophosphoesterase superfamily enzyme